LLWPSSWPDLFWRECLRRVSEWIVMWMFGADGKIVSYSLLHCGVRFWIPQVWSISSNEGILKYNSVNKFQPFLPPKGIRLPEMYF